MVINYNLEFFTSIIVWIRLRKTAPNTFILLKRDSLVRSIKALWRRGFLAFLTFQVCASMLFRVRVSVPYYVQRIVFIALKQAPCRRIERQIKYHHMIERQIEYRQRVERQIAYHHRIERQKEYHHRIEKQIGYRHSIEIQMEYRHSIER